MSKIAAANEETGCGPCPVLESPDNGAPDEQDRTAEEYDEWIDKKNLISRWMRFLLSPGAIFFHNTQAWKLVSALGIRPDNRVLDIGCGYGSLLIYLQQRVGFSETMEGLDVSPHMVNHALREVRKRRLDRVITVRQGKASALPYESGRFDIALSTYVIKHLSDDSLLRMLKDVHRVLKPGGRFCFWEVGPSRLQLFTSLYTRLLSGEVSTTNLRSWNRVSALLGEAGFDAVEPFGRGGFYFLCPTMPRVGFIATKAPMPLHAPAGIS